MTTSGGRRDLDQVRDGLVAWLEATRPELGPITLGELSHPSAGLSNETIIATVHAGDDDQRLVVRLPPMMASFPDHELAPQVEVMHIVTDAGLAAPAPVTLETDTSWLGSPFVVMPFVTGTIPGPASVFDPWLTGLAEPEQRTVQDQMVSVLATLHRIEWRTTPAATVVRGGDGALRDEIAWWRRYLEWAGDGAPLARFVELVEWCAEHCPTDEPPASLLWGDPRLENLILDDSLHTKVVLDWELATVGPAEMDLGWYLGLEQVLRELSGGMTVPGFRPDDDLVAAYEAALGRPVRDLDFHRIFAVVRSICINYRQARISKLAGVSYPLPADERNPLVGIVDSWMRKFES